MLTYIKCSIAAVNNKQVLEFYAVKGESIYYLFTQRYYRSTYEYFKNSVPITDALDHGRMHRNPAIVNAAGRLVPSIRYIEEYYGISLLERKTRTTGRGCATYCPAARGEIDDCDIA